MNELQKKVSAVGVVPVIKLTDPQRDAAPLSDFTFHILASVFNACKSIRLLILYQNVTNLKKSLQFYKKM